MASVQKVDDTPGQEKSEHKKKRATGVKGPWLHDIRTKKPQKNAFCGKRDVLR
jgi:hypothetical protein